MISIFRSYHPAIIFLLLIYAILFRLVLFIQPVAFQLPSSSYYLSQLVYDFISLLAGNKNWIFHVIALLLVFFQALYFNYIINFYRILSQSTYLPAMSYLLISSLFVEFTFFTPALMANTFLLLSISKIFSLYKKEKVLAIIFDAALLISIASLFFFPSIIFFVFLIASLVILRPLNLREYIMAVLGLLVPYYFIGVYFFWFSKLPEFWQTIRISELVFPVEQMERSTRVILVSVALLIVLFWNFIFIQGNIFRMIVQVRSYFMCVILFVAAGIFSMLVQFDGALYHFAWIAIPFGLSFAMFFLEVRRRIISEVLHFFLILTILFFQFFYLITDTT